MVDRRRRGLGPQLDLKTTEVMTDAGSGGGTVAAQLREMTNAVAGGARSATEEVGSEPAQTIYRLEATLSVEGGFLWSALPTGHLWAGRVAGKWSDLESGEFFSSTLVAIPTGLTRSDDGRVLCRSLVGSKDHTLKFETFGPVTLAAASSESYPSDPSPGGTFQAVLEAVWIRAAIPADGLDA